MIIEEMNDRIRNQLIESRSTVRRMPPDSISSASISVDPKPTAPTSFLLCVSWIIVVIVSICVACIHCDIMPNHNEADSTNQQHSSTYLMEQNAWCNATTRSLENHLNQCAVALESTQRELNQTKNGFIKTLAGLQLKEENQRNLLVELRSKDEHIERLKRKIKQRVQSGAWYRMDGNNVKAQLAEYRNEMGLFGFWVSAMVFICWAGTWFWNKSKVLFQPNGYLSLRHQKQHRLHVGSEDEENVLTAPPTKLPKMWSIKPVADMERGKTIRVRIDEVLHGELCAVGHCEESFPGLPHFRDNKVYVHTNDIDTRFMHCESRRCPEYHTLSVMHLDVAIRDIVEGQVWKEWVGTHWRFGLYNWTRVTMGDREQKVIKAKISCPWTDCKNVDRCWPSTPFDHVEQHDDQDISQGPCACDGI